tara:strand:+ start:26087 stop:26293 length:207 start_codon:yes stop_codon:yes gene_type:complete
MTKEQLSTGALVKLANSAGLENSPVMQISNWKGGENVHSATVEWFGPDGSRHEATYPLYRLNPYDPEE